MYSINGRPLDDETLGWRLLRNNTSTQGGITNELNSVPAPGRNGYTPAPSTFKAQTIVLNVRTPWEGLDALLALCAEATRVTRTEDPTKELRVELSSAIPSSPAPEDAWFNVTITLSAYEGVWRDVEATTLGPVSITSSSQLVSGFTGLSAPIYDGDFFLRGEFGEFVLEEVRDWGRTGSWIKTTKAWPGGPLTGLLYIGATQQAFLANESDPWTPVSDASQFIDVSGNGGFRMNPNFVEGDPAQRRVTLNLTTLSQTSTTLRVRARRAYRMN